MRLSHVGSQMKPFSHFNGFELELFHYIYINIERAHRSLFISQASLLLYSILGINGNTQDDAYQTRFHETYSFSRNLLNQTNSLLWWYLDQCGNSNHSRIWFCGFSGDFFHMVKIFSLYWESRKLGYSAFTIGSIFSSNARCRAL
jgi:hypothetical protein